MLVNVLTVVLYDWHADYQGQIVRIGKCLKFQSLWNKVLSSLSLSLFLPRTRGALPLPRLARSTSLSPPFSLSLISFLSIESVMSLRFGSLLLDSPHTDCTGEEDGDQPSPP